MSKFLTLLTTKQRHLDSDICQLNSQRQTWNILQGVSSLEV